uniref:Putative nucleolar protein 5-2 n=1 Tax=Noccaea caerulescens TaxID=107243 RepID=A0A1J3E5S3_NOCCA
MKRELTPLLQPYTSWLKISAAFELFVKMMLLFESPAGFALFRVINEERRSNIEVDIFQDLRIAFSSPITAGQTVSLTAFEQFPNVVHALEAFAQLREGVPSRGLLNLLRANCEGETLLVADPKLGRVIKKLLQIDCVHDKAVMELHKGVRSQFTHLVTGLSDQELAVWSSAVSYGLAPGNLVPNYDRLLVPIVEHVRLLGDVDKKMNTLAMRVREWYGWHFPELAKIVKNNLLYTKCVRLMKSRNNAVKVDFSGLLGDETEEQLKSESVTSTGSDLSEVDPLIQSLCHQVLEFDEHMSQLRDNLHTHMQVMAPNVTALLGGTVAARLLIHDKSLRRLSKRSASGIQMLGAERSFFPAKSTRIPKTEPTPTPKHGYLYETSVVREAPRRFRGKIARVLAGKVAICVRCDLLGEGHGNSVGLGCLEQVRARASQMM